MNKNKQQAPQIKLILSQESFNAFITMLMFYIASEVQAGQTFYSRGAEKMLTQFVNYGNFVVKKNESDNLFIIRLYESEVMIIMRMYNKYICVHQKPTRDYFTEYMRKKTQSS